MDIDERFRNILDTLPAFYKFDGVSEHSEAVKQMHRQKPFLAYQRVVIFEFVHHRLLKLHRLYMSRGYRNPKYAYSTRTCVESARVIISVRRELDRVQCSGQRYWVFKFHVRLCSAAILDLASVFSY